MKGSILDLIRLADKRKASDLHLVVGFPPFLRVVGDIDPLVDVDPVQPEDARAALVDLTTPEEREEFYRTLELDFGYNVPGVGRIRCNAAQQRGSISLAIRLLPPKIPTIDGNGIAGHMQGTGHEAERSGGGLGADREREEHHSGGHAASYQCQQDVPHTHH